MDENPVVHFEMPYKIAKRAARFYNQAFGWKMTETDEEMGNYIIAETTETQNQRPVKPGAINGGFYNANDTPAHEPDVVIAVKDIEAAMEHVKDAGGEIIGEPMNIATVGMFVNFKDTEGNRVAMLQPSQ